MTSHGALQQVLVVVPNLLEVGDPLLAEQTGLSAEVDDAEDLVDITTIVDNEHLGRRGPSCDPFLVSDYPLVSSLDVELEAHDDLVDLE